MKKNRRTGNLKEQGFLKNSRRLLSLLALFFLVASMQVYAQTPIKGVVSDAGTGDPLPGVNVVVKGTSIGVTTDLDGNFTITAAPEAVIVFSYLGYKQQEAVVGNQTVINVALEFAAEELEAITVVGYGTMKRSDITGAVVSVSEEALKTEVANSIDQAIQGKAAGVQVMQNSGSPSAATSIRIRGVNSIRSGNEPLYVIDGVPVTSTSEASGFNWAGGGNGQTTLNPLSTINPSDIVSVEILKDASAAAIYGSQGGNGVILITTRKGTAGDAQINYDFNWGVQTPAKYLDVLNLKEYAQYQNDMAATGIIGYRPEFEDLSLVPEEGTNWQEELFRNAPVMEHNLNISGGSEKTNYSVSLGYKNQDGMIIGSDFERFNGRINVSTQAKKWLKIGTNISASRNWENLNLTDSDDGVITKALLTSPDNPVRGLDGSFSSPTTSGVNFDNPVAKATEITNKIVRTRMLGNIYADIDIAPFLTYHADFGFDINFTNNYNFMPTYDWGESVNETAKSRRSFSNNTFWVVKNYLTFKKVIDAHDVQFMLGQEAQKARWENLTGERWDFMNNSIQELDAGGTDNQLAGSYAGNTTKTSYFGRLNYSYANKYMFTATGRADGSSKFGPNNKWGFFPSFSLGWNVAEESFLQNYDWLNKLKMRAGWGHVGNDNIGDYLYSPNLQVRASDYGGIFLLVAHPNTNVRWESTDQKNVGLDIGLFGNRVEFIAEVYQKLTKDMLFTLPLPDFSGSCSSIGQGWQGIAAPQSNIGEMENKGIEITMNTVNIATSDFSWNTGITFSKNINKVTNLGTETAAEYRKVQWYDFVTKTAVDQPVGQFYGYQVEGVFQSVDEINASPYQGSVDEANGVWMGDLKFKDVSGPDGEPDGVIDDNDRTYIGDPNPDFTYGISNTFRYKNIDLSVFLNGSYGNDIFNFQRIKTEAMLDPYKNQMAAVTDRWTPENTDTDMPRLAPSDPNQNTRISDRYVEDGSYLRISNVTLGYTLPNSILSKTPLSNLRVYGKVQNLYTFTDYSGYDPEVGSYNQDALLTGVDNGRFPMPRTYLVGVSVTF